MKQSLVYFGHVLHPRKTMIIEGEFGGIYLSSLILFTLIKDSYNNFFFSNGLLVSLKAKGVY